MSADEITPNRGESSLPTESTLRDLLKIELARIESNDRRSQVMAKALEVFDAQDRRQFEYASATRDADLQQQADRLAFLRRVVWVFSGFFGAVMLAILGFAFLGNDAQRTLAQDVVGYGLVGIAGFGVITTVRQAIRAFTRP